MTRKPPLQPDSALQDPAGAMRVPASLMAVRDLAAGLRTWCSDQGIDETAAMDLELALVEAANNVVEHGYADCPDGEIALTMHREGGSAVIVLSDRGSAIPESAFAEDREIPPFATEGRGIAIIRACVDTLEYHVQDGVNAMRFEKRV